MLFRSIEKARVFVSKRVDKLAVNEWTSKRVNKLFANQHTTCQLVYRQLVYSSIIIKDSCKRMYFYG